MENEEQLIFYNGPAYALVIGISDYAYKGEPGQKLEEPQFPKLKVADNDARDVANFLNNSRFPKYNSVRLLINEEATLSNIKEEFEILRKNCKQSGVENPLVIVYFSGHGWADKEGRHYLIPYEAQRNKLYSTALLNRDFSLCLDDLGTNRLVVFIDACQAGTIGEEGVKGTYDYHKDLGPSEGRYVIASCGPMQNSYEWKEKENSIFTGRLLQLLNFETDDFDKLDYSEIDISDLYPALRQKVVATAHEEYGADQEPASEINDRTGIVLAINERVRNRKQKESDEVIVRRFLDLICAAIMRTTRSVSKTTIKIRLTNYVVKQKRMIGFDDFYNLFDEQLQEWKASGCTYRFEEGCDLLLDGWEFANEAAPSSRHSTSQQSATPHDELVTAQNSGPSGFQDRSGLSRDLGQAIASTTLGKERPPTQTDIGGRQKPNNPYAVRIQAGSEEPIKPPPAKVFVSYSHKDDEWLVEFKTMVAPLVQQRIIDLWDDTKIPTGTFWKVEIEKALASTKVAVLLVTKNFLASDFIVNNELPQLLNNAKERGAVIFWIMVSDCMVADTAIEAYQAAHNVGEPLDKLTDPERQTVLKEIGQKIKRQVLGT